MKYSKIFIMIALFTCVISSGYSLDLFLNQDDNIQDYFRYEKGNSIINPVVNSIDNEYIIDNVTYYYDTDMEFKSVSENFYIVLDNFVTNSTLLILYRGDLNVNPSLYIQEMTLNEVGRYYFKFEPDFIGEPARIYLGFSNGLQGTYEYIEDKPQGFNTLIGGFVNSFIDIVTINVSMWRLVFYTLIFVIVVAFVGLLFGGSFYIFKQTQKLRESKGFRGER